MILLPDEGVSLDQCLATINGSSWKALLESQNILPVNVKLPKFKIEGKSNLIPALESIGIRKPFSDEADFSKLSDEKVKVSEMRQANSFLIDEKGIEAAAVTEVDFGTTELPPTNPNQVVNFHADRPFFFLLTEQSTGCVLFIGKVTNMK